ncbi:alpha/beta hydrolase-fold protein [Neisseria leonii]|uniref:Alpha/beta hydrolase-fold protein n=1 Tax=Neisseria leonii TaxID=2995413 RepID=A0A9X4E129_9NEIS|nr:alpha/beta hydrolase-fold protein [Neisseria sp. 51.81]MDD9327089.1 alpha/beta hydrolase-fold protein [Neisseria sp. 51.81]
MTHRLHIADRTVSLYLPDRPHTLPLLLTFPDNRDQADELAALIVPRAVLITIEENDWEHTFTPWPAPRLFKKTADFGGGASAFLETLAADILPAAENTFGLRPAWRSILGYSLAGLLAAYSAYRKPLFERIAAVSPSLWFDNWTAFATSTPAQRLPEYAYFSVGSQEKNTKNPRMATVETAISATRQHWQQSGVTTHFTLNSGGHFDHVPQRLAAAANWLLAQ